MLQQMLNIALVHTDAFVAYDFTYYCLLVQIVGNSAYQYVAQVQTQVRASLTT